MAIKFKRLEEITKSLKPVCQTGKSFHATFVYNKNKLICTAHNNYNKMHPYYKFGNYKPTRSNSNKYIPGLHSEVAALIKMGNMDCSNLTFANVRIDNNNQVAISKPCRNCEKLLIEIGFKTLWFYNGKEYTTLKRNSDIIVV